MKVFYTSDLHGEIHLYQQISELVRDFSAEVLILGGDLFPSLRESNRCENMIPTQKFFIAEFLLPFFETCLEISTLRNIFIIPGNWDMGYPDLFSSPVPGVVDLDQKSHHLENGYELIGYPFVPPTPFWPKDYEKMDDPDAPWPPQKSPSYIRSSNPDSPLRPIDPHLYLLQRGTIREDLGKLSRPRDHRRAIYIMHSPPYGTRLDLIGDGKSVGSRSIRAFIESRQPLLTLHGHIHESPEISGDYLDRIGKTLSINPGQSLRKAGGMIRLQAVTFEMENPEEAIIHTCFTKKE